MTDKAKITVEAVVPRHLMPLYARGWNLREAAQACGCSPSHLRSVLLGQRRGSPRLLGRVRALKQKPLSIEV